MVRCKNVYLFGSFGGLLTHPFIITGNKQITDKVYNEAQLIIFWAGKLMFWFSSPLIRWSLILEICYATRINSTEDDDHICNGVKPQSFVFVCTEHLKCLTKIFGIGLNIMFANAISAALEMQVPPALSYKLTTSSSQLNFEKQIQCRPKSLGWVSKICTIGLLQSTCRYLWHCNVTLSIRSRYSDFDITPSFSYIISGVRNLNNGPCIVKSVNNRSVVCQVREL